jgi:beta-glucosidase
VTKKILKSLMIFGIFGVINMNAQIGEKMIDNKIKKMTLEEKIEFIGGYKQFNIRGMKEIGIPEIRLADGPVGVRNFGKATAFPASINLAASFDKKIARKIGEAIGKEAILKETHIVLGPGMNIYRMPICGRNFEYLGEDPYLAGQIAKEYIIGMQDQGVMACAKHYAANNQEFNRHHVSSDLDERTLHEIYLPAFKTSVLEGKVATVMTSYNLVNGIHASEHDYLNNEILKGKWDFDGFIMSDWVSTYDGIACAKGGLDLEMPSGKMMNKETLIPAIQSGELNESIIDDKIRRILNTYDRFNLFKQNETNEEYINDEQYVRDISLEAARGGMVLLKNESNSLPLNNKNIKSIAVIGPNGHPVISGGGGSSYTDPLHPLSLFDAVKKIAGNDVDVTFEKGIFTGAKYPEGIFDEFDLYIKKGEEKQTGVNADFYQGKKLEGKIIHSQFFEKLDLTDVDMWNLPNVPETEYSARFTCYYTPEKSGLYAVAGIGDDGYRIKLDGAIVVDMWRDQGPTRGKHDVFMNAGQEYEVVLEYYQSGGGAKIGLGIKEAVLDIAPEDYGELALEAARNSDVVIFSAGFNSTNESESFDRTFELPYDQSNFINQIAAVNKNIFVVLNAGGNVEMESWIDNVKGLLMAWYPGQEGNLAAAEILFGITNPSGKLPATFEYKLEDNPSYDHYFDDDEDLKVYYGEGIFMGYRYWDKSETKPRYPFGYGLSYTTFDYENLSIEKNDFNKGESVSLSVDIKNTGDIDGFESIQLYVSDQESSLPRPLKELKSFEKIYLKAGESKTVIFTLNDDSFSFYDPAIHDWKLESGKFEILLGSSSVDIRQSVTININ